MRSDTLVIEASPGELRGAVLAAGDVWQVDHYREATPDLTGAVYRGQVRRLDPGMNAAFVDLGDSWPRDGLLRARDAGPKDAPPRIQQLVQEGASVIVQISGGNAVPQPLTTDDDDPDATKGPSVTARVTLPGRYLRYQVNRRGVAFEARPDPELSALWCTAVEDLCQSGEGATLTALLAEDAAKVARDGDEMAYRQLLGDVAEELSAARRTWQTFKDKAADMPGPGQVGDAPAPVAQFLDAHAHAGIKVIYVSDPVTSEAARRWCNARLPQLSSRIEGAAAGEHLFDAHGVEAAIDAALMPSVALTGGGNLLFEPGATLTAIDVNSGGGDGKAGRSGLDTNLAAVPEIARQLRVRGIAGPVVIDFMKMDQANAAAARGGRGAAQQSDRRGGGRDGVRRGGRDGSRDGGRDGGRGGSRAGASLGSSDRDRVVEALRDALAGDPARIHIAGWSPLGHLELTRQHLRSSLAARMLAQTDTSRLPGAAPDAAGYDVLRKIARGGPVGAPVLRAAPSLARLLSGPMAAAVEDAGRRIGQTIAVEEDAKVSVAAPDWPES